MGCPRIQQRACQAFTPFPAGFGRREHETWHRLAQGSKSAPSKARARDEVARHRYGSFCESGWRRGSPGAAAVLFRAMRRVALLLCLSSCLSRDVKRTPAQVAAPTHEGKQVAPTGSTPAGAPVEASRAGCPTVPPGSASRAIAPAMGVSFEPDNATIRVTESGRFVFYAAASLEERRSIGFPGGSRFVDHGDVFLVGEGRRYWIGRVVSGKFSEPIEAPSAGQVQMSPSGSRLVVRHESDDKLELSVYETKSKRWRRISAQMPGIGPINLCGLGERQAVWCPVHAQGSLFQDLLSGTLTAPEMSSEPAPKAWSAVLHGETERDGRRTRTEGRGVTRIEIVGPGPARWVQDVEESAASTLLTCGASNRALVLRDRTRQMETRTLPDWRLIRSWPGTAELVACSDDGKRVAWVSTCDAKSTLFAISPE
jgi:hypothetical protein